jgi:peptidoglycan-associated lipoprotein
MADWKFICSAALAPAILGFALSGCQTALSPARTKGPLIVSASPCEDFTQTLYFDAGSARVTRPAERLLTLAAARARRCVVTGVSVLGLADSPGDSASNLALSQGRADAVKAALHRKGLDKVEIQTIAAGASGAQTPSGQDNPVRRRADITFHLAPPASN